MATDLGYIKEYLDRFSFDGHSQNNLFRTDNRSTEIQLTRVGDLEFKKYINEFWTSKQRQGCSLHEISYRACFKPELPRFFVQLLTNKGDVVYDPFAGRGTTVIEAGLMGRRVIANDINPLS